jgi:hypothetical protein
MPDRAGPITATADGVVLLQVSRLGRLSSGPTYQRRRVRPVIPAVSRCRTSRLNSHVFG